jgi:YesN/AraC family two-component response regulator
MSNESPHRGTVVVADDEEMIRLGLAEVLRRCGFTCAGVATGAEALAQIGIMEVDAVISDIHMPGNAGLELVESIRQIAPHLPVVLLTGRPTVESAARSVRLPVAAYLTKPPNIEELCNILDEAIADHRSARLVRSGRERLQLWEKEVDAIERELRVAPPGKPGGPVASYLRMTLRQVLLMLADLEQATAGLERSGPGSLVSVEHEAALRKAVEVLERTKQNFKSKDLAELRKQLEQLLQKNGPGEGVPEEG